jgi:DNA-binding CsgD family transcriptional regulator
MLMAEGKSTERIAALLSISRPTARNHIQNIFQKLHVHSRAEAVAYAFQHGLLAKL